jgi:hypothetical protein
MLSSAPKPPPAIAGSICRRFLRCFWSTFGFRTRKRLRLTWSHHHILAECFMCTCCPGKTSPHAAPS